MPAIGKKTAKDNLYEQCKNLSDVMSKKVEELAKQNENIFLSLTGFLIATNGIIITSSTVTKTTKYCLVLSIVCFVGRMLCSLKFNQNQALKVSTQLKKVFPIPGLKTRKEKIKAITDIENGFKVDESDIIRYRLINFLQTSGIVLFIIGLFIYL